MATSVVNLGVFLGAGMLQPLVGAVLDRGSAACAWLVRDPRDRRLVTRS